MAPWPQPPLLLLLKRSVGPVAVGQYATQPVPKWSERCAERLTLPAESGARTPPTSHTHEHALPDYCEVESGPEWGHFLAREFQAQNRPTFSMVVEIGLMKQQSSSYYPVVIFFINTMVQQIM